MIDLFWWFFAANSVGDFLSFLASFIKAKNQCHQSNGGPLHLHVIIIVGLLDNDFNCLFRRCQRQRHGSQHERWIDNGGNFFFLQSAGADNLA